jgi:hypothetical protein
MDKNVKVEPVNHYGLNLYNRYGKLIATAPQVNGLFVLDRVLEWESTEYTDIDDSCVLPLRRLGMHLGTMQRSGCYGTAAWHTSVSRLWRSCRRSLPTLRR